MDVNSRLNAILMLSAVNLPGGELRKRSAEDELKMRQYLTEGDLISVSLDHHLLNKQGDGVGVGGRNLCPVF